MNQMDVLTKCMDLVIRKKVCPDTQPREWAKIVLQAHTKGYLYSNKDFTAFACAYRIPEWKEKYADQMPFKEEGDILYCAWSASESKDRLSLLKMVRAFTDIKELIFYHRNSDTDLRRFPIRRKHGQEKRAISSSAA